MSLPDRLPAFDLTKIINLRCRLMDEVFSEVIGASLTGDSFQALLDRLLATLPASVNREALSDSSRNLIGSPLEHDAALDLAWRLAGNVKRLKKGIAIPPWVRQPEPEWVPLRVESVCRVTRVFGKGDDRKEKPGANVKLRVLSGFAAGRTIQKFWSRNVLAHFKTTFGFSRFDLRRYRYEVLPTDLNLPFHDVREIGRFRFVVKIEAQYCRDGPGFSEDTIRCPVSMVTWNRTIQKRRQRIGWQCPMGWSTACHDCPVGWNDCSASCHAETFVRRVCHRCGVEAWHDPEIGLDLCVDCLSKPG